MNWNGSSSAGTIAGPMMPTQPLPPSSKRRSEDVTAIGNAVKRSKKDAKPSSSNKRKHLNSEELAGGLMIVRAPHPRQPSAQGSHPQPDPSQSRPRPSSSQSVPAQPSKSYQPPSKKFRTDANPLAPSARPVAKGKERDILSSLREDPEVEEDVRRMDSEADDLRRLSRAYGSSLNPDIAFTPSSSMQKSRRQSQLQSLGTSRETPVKGQHHGQSRRKSSLGMRGKRISSSFEAGVISHPHNSVSDSSFHKHIDCDLPPSARARQLLIWCSSRAMSKSSQPPPEPSTSKRQSKTTEKLPFLSEEGSALLRSVQEDVIRLLADRKIDTGVFSRSESSPEKKITQNAQNVRNRQCQIAYMAQIERAEAEASAWSDADRFYDARLSELVDLGQPEEPSAKVKGKQRAASQDLDSILPHADEMSNGHRDGLDLASKVLAGDPNHMASVSERLKDLQFEIDSIHAFVHSASQCTDVAESNLNYRFALLSLSLTSRSQPNLPILHAAYSADPSTHLPSSLVRPETISDPQELLRALSRVDAERPPAQIGNAARQAARQVQRANEAGGLLERRLTGVSPPTPRKPPGTPRRPATPRRDR